MSTRRTRSPFEIARVVLAAACGLALAGCPALSDSLNGTPPASDAGPSTSCPDDLHSACPTPAPSYVSEVQPIIQAHCLQCHRPGGQEPTENSFTTYAGIFADRQAIEDQINVCRMPPVDAGVSLPTASRVILLTWLSCGAPNN